MKNRSQPALVILSTGRAGSGFISRLLTAAGVPCGHEEFYNTRERIGGGLTCPKAAESSWLALPWIEAGHFSGRVVHQVRDPLRVLSSLMNGDFHKRNPDNDHARFQRAHVWDWRPRSEDEWLAFFLRFTAEWLRRCSAAAETTYRVEDVDLPRVADLTRMARRVPSTPKIEAALEAVPNTTNKHKAGPALDWGDLPDTDDTRGLYEHAKRWGYAT